MAQFDLNPSRLGNVELTFVDSRWFYRLLEIIPGFITWAVIISSIILSFISPSVVAYFIIAFDLYWLLKSLRMSLALVRGYHRLSRTQAINWAKNLESLANPEKALTNAMDELVKLEKSSPPFARLWPRVLFTRRQYQKYQTLKQTIYELSSVVDQKATLIKPNDLYHAVILATYNESLDTLRPSVEALIKSDYDLSKIIFVLAYEKRGGEVTQTNARKLEQEFKSVFGNFLTVGHPANISGEVKGKGSNITFAGRELLRYVTKKGIDPEHVIVTTLDSDNRVSQPYFSCLAYKYAIDPNRTHKSYQPIPMFFNNIWDVPAPMRVIATGNSFWLIIETVRPHRLRNFAAHAQSLRTLIDTDFWSVKTIVEDGHQYWRTFFAYDGDHSVEPIYLPIYQDAVLADSYLKTIKNQFIQLRRWAWGISDFAYVVVNSIKNKRITLGYKLLQIGRLLEGHFSWATAPLILSFVAWLPLILNSSFKNQVLAHQLPVVASRILTLATAGLFVTIWISLISLPPRPERYRRTRFIPMILQWVLLPVTAICFGSFAAIYAQTRLLLGKYLEYDVTPKVIKQ